MRGSSSKIMFQSGSAMSLPFALLLSLSLAAQDKSRGENEVVALLNWVNAVA